MSRKGKAYPLVVHRALEFAARAHEGQYRKNRDEAIPYLSHCAMVGLLLARAGFEPEVTAAGVLHDTVEDGRATLEELSAAFGDRVAEIVRAVTERDKSLPWEARKERYLKNLAAASPEAIAVACADKIQNLWSLVQAARAGGDPWAMLKRDRAAQLDNFERLASLFRTHLGGPLLPLFEEAYATVQAECS